jgi:hypothetical protein
MRRASDVAKEEVMTSGADTNASAEPDANNSSYDEPEGTVDLETLKRKFDELVADAQRFQFQCAQKYGSGYSFGVFRDPQP